MKIPPKSKRKISVKNEKKVDRGELDEIFDRIRMKKKIQKEKIEKMEHSLKIGNSIKGNNDEENMNMNIECEKEENDEKKINYDEKNDKCGKIKMKTKEKMKIEIKPQRKLTDWLRIKNNEIGKVVKADDEKLETMKISKMKKMKKLNDEKIR